MQPRNRQTLRRFILMTFVALFILSQTSHAASRIVFIHTDMLGSPMATTDENGNIISRENVTPYGDSLGKRDSTNAVAVGSPEHGLGYTGHVRDRDLGLTYMQARYYDPTIGRFMGADPVGFLDNGDPAHFNRYAYANNNPYYYTDPTGEDGLAGGPQFNANAFGLGFSGAFGLYGNVDLEGASYGGYGSLEFGPVGGAAGWGLGLEVTAYDSDVRKALDGPYNISGLDVPKLSGSLVTTIPTEKIPDSVNGVQISLDIIGSPTYGNFHSRYGMGASTEFDGFTWGGISDALGLGGGGNGDNIRSGVESVPSTSGSDDFADDGWRE